MSNDYGILDRDRRGSIEVRLVDRSGNLIHELPNATVQDIEWTLNEPGGCRISVPTMDDRAADIELGLTEFQIWRNDNLWFWGVPWRAAGNQNFMEFECTGLLEYFAFRFVTTTTLQYTSLDQLVIGWNLLSFAQTGANTSFNISSSDFTPSGVTRSREYKRNEHGNILDLLMEFPDLDDGFDYEITYNNNGERFWTPYYPRKGTTRPNLVLEWGKNISAFDFSEDASQLANHVYMTGGTSGQVKFEQNYRDQASVDYRGAFYAIASEGSQLDVDWLLARAKREVEERKEPVVLPEITVVNQPNEVVETLKTGDIVPVIINRGRVSVNGMFRIMSKTWYPNETLRLVLNKES